MKVLPAYEQTFTEIQTIEEKFQADNKELIESGTDVPLLNSLRQKRDEEIKCLKFTGFLVHRILFHLNNTVDE